MKILNHRFALIAGALLVFPTLYFLLAAILHYEMGNSALWKPIDPIFENPANKHLGWNVNLLILFGPVLALLLNFFSVVKIKWANEKDHMQVSFSIRKSWINILIVIISGWYWLLYLLTWLEKIADKYFIIKLKHDETNMV